MGVLVISRYKATVSALLVVDEAHRRRSNVSLSRQRRRLDEWVIHGIHCNGGDAYLAQPPLGPGFPVVVDLVLEPVNLSDVSIVEIPYCAASPDGVDIKGLGELLVLLFSFRLECPQEIL